MPPAASRSAGLDHATRLQIGDTVSVAVGCFGKSYAESRGARPWTTETVRDNGTVVGREANMWLVNFGDGEHRFERKALSFVSHSDAAVPAGRRRAAPIVDDSDGDEAGEVAAAAVAEQPVGPTADDSSDEEMAVGAEEHEQSIQGRALLPDARARNEWVRDDDYGVDERAKHGYADKGGPKLNDLDAAEAASIFKMAMHFLPKDFLDEMANLMEQKGKAKYTEDGNRHYMNWKVSSEDICQWIGVWMYMLAFPQAGGRREYWMEPRGGYGPRHQLGHTLRLGENGDKGLAWFESMHHCFVLPMYPNSEADPFRLTRRWWDSLRDAFERAVTCGWLMVMDESMVRWMGRGMPGLMVILRKPTPVGLELHTLCCALSGILSKPEPFAAY